MKRKSNFELLRIVAMMMIVASHASYWGGFDFEAPFSVNKLFIDFLYMLGEIGVNCFMLISGYFMVRSKFRIKKIINIIGETYFYVLFCNFLLIFLGYKEFYFSTFFLPIIRSKYWYITAYVEICFISPFLNLFVNKINQDQLKKIITILLVFYCAIPTFVCWMLSGNIEDLLFFNRFIWFVTVYLVGAYNSLYEDDPIKKYGAFRMFVFGISVELCFIIVMELLIKSGMLLNFDQLYLWSINSLTTFVISCSIFEIFRKLNIQENLIINYIASCTLGIYLFHSGNLVRWIWTEFAKNDAYFNKWIFIPRMIASILIVFLIGLVIDSIRKVLARFIQRILKHKEWDLKKIDDFFDVT